MSSWFTTKENKYTKIPNEEVCRNPNLTVEEKALILSIASRNPSYPSIDDLRHDTGLCRSMVNKWKKSLQKQNVIDWVSGHSNGKSNLYTIRPSSEWRVLPIEQKKRKKSKSTSSTQSDPSPQTEPSPRSAPTEEESKSIFKRRSVSNAATRTDSSPPCESPIIPINKINNDINNTIDIRVESSNDSTPDSIGRLNQVSNRNKYSIFEFKKYCEFLGPNSQDCQYYLYQLIKSDENFRINFSEIAHIVITYEKFLKDNDLDSLIEEYRKIFFEARQESEVANV